MITESFIILQANEDTYKGIYCQTKGYPEHNGKILNEYYRKRKKVEDLIKNGHISTLKTKVNKGDKLHHFNKIIPDVYKDYRISDNKNYHLFHSLREIEEIADIFWANFIYIYTQYNEWYFKTILPHCCWQKLDDYKLIK